MTRTTRTERCGGTVTLKVGQHIAEVALNTRTYKHVFQVRGAKAKDSTIVRIAAKLERAESTMFAVSHRARCEERATLQREERRAKRRK
jgi:hypothetical protein